jgi:Type IV secretory system Conjugative DNA transfer
MIQTPRSEERQSDIGLYGVLAALWILPGLVFALAALAAGGAPHTHVVDWPYAAIRSVTQGHGRVLPWQWVGAATVRSSVTFWAVVVAVTVPLLAAVLAVLVVLRGGIPAVFPFLSRAVHRSRWAHRHALVRAGLMTSGPTGHRLVVGRHDDGWVAVRGGVSVLALGPPGSGKSAALCIPAIGEWEGCVVAVSDGTDLIEIAAGVRQHRGRVDVLDPSDRTGLATCTWSSPEDRMSFEDAEKLVFDALDGREPVPDELTRRALTCVLYTAGNRGVGAAGAVAWLDDVSGDALVGALLEVRDRAPRAISLAHELMERGRDERAACFSAVRQLLRAHFEQASLGGAVRAFRPAEFLSGPANTLFVVTPTAWPLASGSLEALLTSLVTGAEQRRSRRTLLLVLDGCAAVASLPGLADHLAARSPSVTVLATMRDLDDCAAHAERDLSELVQRARAIVLLGGAAGEDHRVPNLMHQLVRRQLATRGRRWARVRVDDDRPDLLPPEAARHLGHGRALLVHERIAPAMLWMRNCYEDADLQARFSEHPYVRGVARITPVS